MVDELQHSPAACLENFICVNEEKLIWRERRVHAEKEIFKKHEKTNEM